MTARIAIDATALPVKPVGAGNYIVHLTRSLAALESGFEWIIFVQRASRNVLGVEPRKDLKIVELDDKPPAARLVWEQARFPALIRQMGVDLLHSPHYTRPVFLSCRSVVTFHDMTFFLFPHLHTRSKRIFFPLAMQMSKRRADLLIADSESTRQDAIRILKISPEKIVTVPLGVSPDFRPITDCALKDEVRRKYKLPDQFILFVGLVEPRKNLPLLLDAYYQVCKQGDAPPLVITGRRGWMYEQVFEQIRSLGLQEKVHFTGYVSSQELPIVYNLAEVFVYPSLYEGFGFPPLEAMACGTPVITSAVSSMPEYVGSAGILVPPGDQTALAGALRNVLDDEKLRRELKRKGPEQAAKYTWERTARQTLQLYRQVLQNP